MPQSKSDSVDKGFWKNPIRCPAASLHLYFLFLSIPLVIFLSAWTPPFLSPDEPGHFARAYQIAGGKILGSDGGYIDEGILRLWNYISEGHFPPQVHYSPEYRAGAEEIPWTGNRVFYEFPNIAQYSPTGYLPQALGIMLGKLVGAGVARTLILARLFNGMMAILVCTFALFWCRAGKVFMFSVLLLPMTLCLFASASQDASLIAFTSLAFSLISRQLTEGSALSRGKIIVLLVLFLVISLGRPPYAALTLVLFIPGLLPHWKNRPTWLPAVAIAGVNFIMVAAWWLITFARMRTYAHPDSQNGQFSSTLQLLNLIHHPEISLQLIKFISSNVLVLLCGMIGIIGWRDTITPLLYYPAMLLILSIAMIAEFTGSEESGRRSYKLIFTSFAIAAFAIYFIQYLIWSPVGATAIYSIQGRYLIPLVVAVGLGISGHRQNPQVYARLSAIVVTAQMLTCICLPYAIYVRYYSR